MTRSIKLLGLILIACSAAQLASAQTYNVTDIGTLSGTQTFPTSVNDLGTVAGSATIDTDIFTHAVSWTKRRGIKDLGTLGGDSSVGQAVNDFGFVAGGSQTTGDLSFHAFLYVTDWRRGEDLPQSGSAKLIDLGTLGGSFSLANGVNLFAQVVGFSTLSGEASQHAFVWSVSNGLKDLGTLGGTNSEATAINLKGQIVGSSDVVGDTATDAVLWDPKKGIEDLGNLGGGFGQATAVNLRGQIVGFSNTPTETHAFLFSSGILKDLATLGGTFSQANGINSSGRVVGTSTIAQDTDSHAFIWTKNSGLTDLNLLIPNGSGWDLQNATSINEVGQIAGTGVINGATHGFLLTPIHHEN